jgi:hypothetical protein
MSMLCPGWNSILYLVPVLTAAENEEMKTMVCVSVSYVWHSTVQTSSTSDIKQESSEISQDGRQECRNSRSTNGS